MYTPHANYAMARGVGDASHYDCRDINLARERLTDGSLRN